MSFRSGFACIVGRPNAGKSTLLNALAGEKLAIVSPKPQTTRNRVLGVIHVPKQKGRSGAQVILIDTPGVHRPESSLGRKMMSEVRAALDGCDVVLMIADAARKSDSSEQVLFATSEEVPHSTTVIVEQFEEGTKLARIAATIYCERDSQKGILIGRQGQMLKKIGTAARLEIERMLGKKVFLELFVKVRANWRESRGFIEELDWRKQLEYLVAGEPKPKA